MLVDVISNYPVIDAPLHVQNDDVRWITKQPLLSAIVQTWHFSLFVHFARMPGETDAASHLENWRRLSDALVLHYCMDEDYSTRPEIQ